MVAVTCQASKGKGQGCVDRRIQLLISRFELRVNPPSILRTERAQQHATNKSSHVGLRSSTLRFNTAKSRIGHV